MFPFPKKGKVKIYAHVGFSSSSSCQRLVESHSVCQQTCLIGVQWVPGFLPYFLLSSSWTKTHMQMGFFSGLGPKDAVVAAAAVAAVAVAEFLDSDVFPGWRWHFMWLQLACLWRSPFTSTHSPPPLPSLRPEWCQADWMLKESTAAAGARDKAPHTSTD